MKPLTDRILELVSGAHGGLSLRAAMKTLHQGPLHTRAAFEALDKAGRARLFRRGRGRALYLAPPDSQILICAIVTCRKEFTRGRKSKRVTCSRQCHCALGWSNPEKAAKRRRSISEAAKLPHRLAATAAHNKRRWSKPGEREKLAEQNRREWKDPEKAAIRAAKIRLKHQRPESRKFYSDMRKAHWADPAMRKKIIDAATKSQRTQAYRALLSEYLKARWKDPVMREKYTRANAAKNTPERRTKTSQCMKKLWANPVWRKAMLKKTRAARKISAAKQRAATAAKRASR